MDRKILLIGHDRAGGVRISNLIALCEFSEFDCIHFQSLRKAKNSLLDHDHCLVLLNLRNGREINGFLGYMKENYPQLPILVVFDTDRAGTQSMMDKGAHHVIHPDSLDKESLTSLILSAIEQKRVENELRLRDQILQAVNYSAEVFLSQLDWEARINDVLNRFGAATHSDRVSIYKNENQIEIGLVQLVHAEWTAPDILQQKDTSKQKIAAQPNSIPLRWLESLKKGEVISASVFDLPSSEQPQFMKRDVQSLAVIPIFTDLVWWGFISFEQHRTNKKWSRIEIHALLTAAKILGAAIARLDAENRLTHLATHDYLTNLPNRMLLEDRFDLAVSRADRAKKKFGIIAIDLDKFKNVNDVHGHPFGDKVLIEVAWRLSEAVRSSDTCARIGGDEFTVLAEGLNNKKDLMRVIEKLAHALEPEIQIEGKQVKVTASMGASIFPNNGTHMEELMKAADVALYQVKDVYSGYKIFTDEQYSLLADETK